MELPSMEGVSAGIAVAGAWLGDMWSKYMGLDTKMRVVVAAAVFFGIIILASVVS